AFVWEPRGGEAIQAQVDVDRIYQRLYTIQFDIDALKDEAGSVGVGVAPGAKIGEDNTASAGIATPSASGSAGSVEEQIAALEAEAAALEAQLAGMEAEEARLIEEQQAAAGYSIRNFTTMSGLHLRIFLMTLLYSFCVTLICFVVCYPIAYTV